MTAFLLFFHLVSSSPPEFIYSTGGQLHLITEIINLALILPDYEIGTVMDGEKRRLIEGIRQYINGAPTNNNRISPQVQTRDCFPDSAAVESMVNLPGKTVTNRVTIRKSGLYLGTSLTTDRSKPEEIRIEFRIPLSPGMKNIFYGGDSTLVINKRRIHRVYRQNFFIPIIAIFDKKRNCGLSIIVPPGIKKPSLSFTISPDTLYLFFENLALAKDCSVNVGFNIISMAADTRCGLKYMLDAYPEYFMGASIQDTSDPGLFSPIYPWDDEHQLMALKARGVKTGELHGYFPFYGLYAPVPSEWELIMDSDRMPIAAWESGAAVINRNSYQRTRTLNNLAQGLDIHTYLYFQPFEAWYQYADKYFPGDIARDSSAKTYSAWRLCRLMNPDPPSAWGRQVINQARELLRRYPNCDGIFWDRMDYGHYDYNHDDGVTMVNGKTPYMLGFALEKINNSVFEIFHGAGKVILGNGPTSLEVCRDLDGVVAEGNLETLEKLQYLGLVRPIIYLPYDSTPEKTEEKLKNCLLCGAFPSVTYGDSTCQKLDEKYRALFEILKGRTWVLTPDPIMVPDQYRSNIFRTRDGDYAVVVISPDKSQLDNSFEYNIPMTVNLPEVKEITNIYLLSGDWTGIYEIKFKRHENLIEFLIPGHISNSLILLTRGKRYQLSRFFDNRIWMLDEITLTLPKNIFIQSHGYETVYLDVTNNTGRKQTLRITTKAINNNGEIQIPGTLTLDKYETKSITARIKTEGDASFTIIAQNGSQTFSSKFSVRTGLTTESNDLFHDDFSRGMNKWTINRGIWHTDNNIAGGSGPGHFAYILNNHWFNYQYQVRTRIVGSDDPGVDWLKSYIFFRVQDDRNFYRFGIHGDGGVVDLFKCVNGEWFQLGFVNFMPKPDTWYTLMVELQGNRIRGFINGEKIMEAQDLTFPSGGIGIGALEDAMQTEYRDVILKN